MEYTTAYSVVITVKLINKNPRRLQYAVQVTVYLTFGEQVS